MFFFCWSPSFKNWKSCIILPWFVCENLGCNRNVGISLIQHACLLCYLKRHQWTVLLKLFTETVLVKTEMSLKAELSWICSPLYAIKTHHQICFAPKQLIVITESVRKTPTQCHDDLQCHDGPNLMFTAVVEPFPSGVFMSDMFYFLIVILSLNL